MSTNKSVKPNEENTENTCVVCFKPIIIYAIGECDHLCCYECSTRIRVLCCQNDCPICRRDLSKVIFSKKFASYQELDVKNRSGLYNTKYRICFADAQVQNAFFNLLDNRCSRCNAKPFNKFEHLKDHVRKEHELFYCDICTEHLKIFSTERRCYTRSELATHRRKGDPDNKGHRGHPNCEYCDCRFLDKDELFRHLRREHFFCHFCDAEGCNNFYENYNTLRDHFRDEHFLCEEVDCEQQQFTNVFRTEIDLKAHRATMHAKSMNKYANKQTRTLELEFSYGPRPRQGHGHNAGEAANGNHTQNNHNNRRNNNNRENNAQGGRPNFESQPEFDYVTEHQINQNQSKKIDAHSEQEFPSLAGGGSGAGASFRPNNVSVRRFKVFGTAGLARTKENFPALGTNDEALASTNNNDGFSRIATSSLLRSSAPISTTHKPPSSSMASSKPTTSMMIHVSNRPAATKQTNGNGKSTGQSDFPALPVTGHGKNRNADLFLDMDDSSPNEMLIRNGNFNAISAKHRALVDDYVPMANTVAAKLMVAQVPEVKKPDKPVSAPKLNSSNAFPALGNGSSQSKATWMLSKTVSRPKELKKTKVAAAPDLREEKFTNLNALRKSETSDNSQQPKKEKSNNSKKENNDKKNNNEVTNTKPSKVGTFRDEPSESKDNKKSGKTNSMNKENEINMLEADSFPTLSGEPSKRGPPGFDESLGGAKSNPPPGFNNVTLNSVARNINKLTFTNSVGESFNILPSQHSYAPPPNAHKRNQVLVTHFQKSLKTPEALGEFRQMSQMFRDGTYLALPYYEHCKFALSDKFQDIFPELLAMLPDIVKQQELYLVYSQDNKNKPKFKSKSNRLEVCATCKQVMITDDLSQHVQSHFMENNFPILGNDDSGNLVSSSAWKK